MDEPNSASSASSFGPSKGLLKFCLVVTLFLVGYMSKRGTFAFGGPEWGQRQVVGMHFDAPCDLRKNPLKIPRSIAPYVESAEEFVGQRGRGTFQMWVGQIVFKPNTPLDIDRFATAAMQQAIERVGNDGKPKFTVESTMVSGFPARRTHYVNTVNGRPARMDCLVVMRGRKLWAMGVTTRDNWSEADVERIFASVEID